MEILRPGFIYTIEHLDEQGRVISRQQKHNLMPTAMLNYLIGAGLLGTSRFTTFYLGLFSNNWSPASDSSMTTLIADAGENKEYTGTARQLITLPAASAGATSTLADPNVFEFTDTQTIRGAFVTTTSAWDSSTGLLCSAVLWDTPETPKAGGRIRVPVAFALM